MNKQALRLLNQELTASKFVGKSEVRCRYKPKFPKGSEREFQRLMKKYVQILETEVKRRMPEVVREYKRLAESGELSTSLSSLQQYMQQTFVQISTATEKRLERLGIMAKLLKLGNYTKEYAKQEWQRAVHSALGIDLLSDYYNGAFYETELNNWLTESVSYISSIKPGLLTDLQSTLYDDFLNGRTIRDIAKDIQEQFGVTERRAELIARDQIGTLNARITQKQHEDAGVTKYEWSDSGDGRVRACHRALNGHIFEYKNPPEQWYETKSRGRVMTGDYANPGEYYACRCVAYPVFEFDTLELPISQPDSEYSF